MGRKKGNERKAGKERNETQRRTHEHNTNARMRARTNTPHTLALPRILSLHCHPHLHKTLSQTLLILFFTLILTRP